MKHSVLQAESFSESDFSQSKSASETFVVFAFGSMCKGELFNQSCTCFAVQTVHCAVLCVHVDSRGKTWSVCRERNSKFLPVLGVQDLPTINDLDKSTRGKSSVSSSC
jgi:hypothetical protein